MSGPSVLLIDAGLGNIGSVKSALDRHHCTVLRVRDPSTIKDPSLFTHVILPGVGAFTAGMSALDSTGWSSWIIDTWVPLNKPLLGICLGMQLLATEGYEGCLGSIPTKGLGLIPGTVKLLYVPSTLVLPHVGWNSLKSIDDSSILMNQIPEGADMYFVHSYQFIVANEQNLTAVSDYGGSFAAIVVNDCYMGVQFHPEKSQRFGKQLISNFLNYKSC